MHFPRAALFVLPALLIASVPAFAESVALAGMMGSKALLIVDGGAPKPVAPGDSWKGVKVISTSGDLAVVEQSGKRINLRVGEAPVSSGSGGANGKGNRIVMTAGSGGHFLTVGTINGNASVQFMVDTGATAIGMGMAEADRAGIDYKKGQAVNVGTANGTTRGYLVRLKSVRIGDVEVFDVEAVVSPASMPYVLLGNSFLGRFQMTRDSETMVLTRRY